MRTGVEPFDVDYGLSYSAVPGGELAMECPIVEDDGRLTLHRPPPLGGSGPGQRIAFVDGTVRTEARLTRRDDNGVVTPGQTGTYATGASLVEHGRRVRVEHVTCERVVVFGGGRLTALPEQPGGWRWRAASTDSIDPSHVDARIRRFMRDAEGELAERLAGEGWLTVVDGPLNNVRASRGTPVIGYVKTHPRPMLAPDLWGRVPDLSVGERSSMFAIGHETYGCYLRVGDPGPWASSWAGIARLEVPSGAGREIAAAAFDDAAAWLPRFASAAHRDARAPVNLAPVAALEAYLHRHQGDRGLALRAVRAAALQLGSGTSDGSRETAVGAGAST